MSGRSNSHRLTLNTSDPCAHERYFPLRATVSPGISRSMSSSHLSPGVAAVNYRDTMTIRAVSPDVEDVEDVEDEDTDDSLAPQHSPTTPPRTPSRSNYGSRESSEASEPASPRKMMQAHHFPQFSELSLMAKGPSISGRNKHAPFIPAMEGKPVETLPASMLCNSRQRLGISASPPTSTGYPSTTSAPSPVNTKLLSKGGKAKFLRPQGSITTFHKPTAPQEPTVSPIQPTDVSKILKLMKELRGRMEGHLEYKVSENLDWNKGYCLINEDTGSLVHQRDEGISAPPVIIVPDLRGCQVKPSLASDESDGIIEVLTHSCKLNVKIRPMSLQQYDFWLAALLCWQPIRPAGAQNKMIKPHPPILTQERKGPDRRRNSDASLPREAAIIKVGKMLLWRKGGIATTTGLQTTSTKGSKQGKGSNVAWEKISCTLQENGELRMYTEVDTILLTVIQLSQLNRCAVQILDPSILAQDFCIAIYPQYSPSSSSSSLARPVYLALETRVLFEVWFVLLRAFTMPELYGPAPCPVSPPMILEGKGLDLGAESTCTVVNPLSDSYRIQRSLFLRIVEAKITGPRSARVYDSVDKADRGDHDNLSSSIGSHHSHLSEYKEKKMDCYAEVVLDGEVRAKTMIRTKTHNPFWREDYEFGDLPTVLSDVSVILKQRDPRSKKGSTGGGPGSVTGSGGYGGGLGGASIPGSRDTIIGRVDIQLDELKMDNETEGWWPLMSRSKGMEEKVGEMFLKIGLEELIVLMGDEYKGLSELLYKFSNGLTHELAVIMTQDLRRLASTLLKIFQAAGKASEWLMVLAAGEVDGIWGESLNGKLLSDSWKEKADAAVDPIETFASADCLPDAPKRDAGKGPLVEANILFRGNSLLTKALDAHMRRLGREYLEDTLGTHLKKIVEEDIYCEVDPIRLERPEDLGKNWKTLLSTTRAIWQAIYMSPQRCPLELRRILKHIRSCVEERYGDMLRSVSYRSVSGFLFLRFFCPAVLNPKLFGLLKDHPGTRAQRTLTLIAKSLQGLANMTTFGIKEPWMEPMNEFLTEHTAEFKDFIESVSNIPPSKYLMPAMPPSYATPTTILPRLPQSAREGVPSLPYLIDQPRAFASLVIMWDKWYPKYAIRFPELRLEGDLARFHERCVGILERMRECVEKAENAERPNSGLSNRWEEVAEKITASHKGPLIYGPNLPQHYSNNFAGIKSKDKSQKILGVGVATSAACDGIIDKNEDGHHYIGNYVVIGHGNGSGGNTLGVSTTSGNPHDSGFPTKSKKLSAFVGEVGGTLGFGRKKPKMTKGGVNNIASNTNDLGVTEHLVYQNF